MYSVPLVVLGSGITWDIGIGIGGLFLTIVSIAVTIIIFVQGRKYKALAYEILSDVGILNATKDLGEALQLSVDGHQANYIRLVYIKLANAGNAAIDSEDYLYYPDSQHVQHALKLNFGEHRVIRYAIHDVEPETLFDRHMLNTLLQQTGPNQITLQGVPLNPRNALFVKALCLKDLPPDMTARLASLPNKDREVKLKITGQIREGIIKEYVPTLPRSTTGRIRIVASILLAAIFLLVSFYGLGIGALLQGQCGIGAAQDGGSTAFFNTAFQEAQKYHSACVLGSISVGESNSQDGLVALENHQIQIANSELPSSDPNLQDHQIAAIIFTLIVNQKVTGITSLSSAQIQQIYNGQYHFWDQVNKDAPHLAITVLERPSGSGTLAALVKHVLNGKEPQDTQVVNVSDSTDDVVSKVSSTPGAIGYVALSAAIAANASVSILDINGQAPGAASIESGQYQYWAIEHMYTQPDPGPLASSFINFVANDVQTDATFIQLSQLNQIPPAVLKMH